MVQNNENYYTQRNELPEKLEQLLISVKNYKGEYEYEHNYEKVFEKLQNTNPFSVLVFYENPKQKISSAKIKKINPNVPDRMLSNMASYVQFYFTPELEEMRLGTYLGSGYRSTQSTYALALSSLSDTTNVPTYVLIYDNQNKIKHVLSSKELIVQPHEVLQNVEKAEADKILHSTIKAYALRNEDYSIESIFTKINSN